MSGLRASRSFCRRIMRAHSRSFYLSTRLLPRAKRSAIEALYAFFRCVDDAADTGTLTTERRRQLLRGYRHDVGALGRAGYAGDAPWFPALAAAHAAFGLDRVPLLQLVDGCARDLERVDLRSMDDLEEYARAVAGTVGRSVIPILGASDADSLQRAERLGIAMQFTNILRDVAEDRAMGRNYLPLAEFPSESASAVMRRIAGRARGYYREARQLQHRLPNDGSRAAFLMAHAFYERILCGIEERAFDPNGARVIVSDARRISLAARCVITAYTGLAIIR